jgi:ribosome-associated translation inhibitor RaiA
MNVHVSYKAGKTPDLEREFQSQLQKLGNRLQIFKPDLIHLHAIVEQANRKSSASLNLRLPSGQMAAQGTGESAIAAVKSAFSELISQVTKHKDLLRGHWARKSVRRDGRGRLNVPEEMPASPEAGRLLQTEPSAGAPSTTGKTDGAAMADVEVWLSANLRALEEFVGDCQRALARGQQAAVALAGELVPSPGP